jgi:hypothetical protein
VLVVVLIAGAVFVVLWRGSGAHEASVQDARDRFRRSSSTIADPDPATLRPEAGVYLYRGVGTEELSLPPKTQHQGPRMPATVTHRADGCWTVRLDYNSRHWQTWEYCPRDGGLVERGGETFETWDFVFTKYDSTSRFSCDPPAIVIRAQMRAGDSWSQSCRGTSSGTEGEAVSSGPFTYVGEETIDVGGTQVPAHRFHQERTLRGSQTGTQTAELWFAKRSGLPLRNEREVTVHTDTIVGSSTYTERGSFRLTSLQPER